MMNLYPLHPGYMLATEFVVPNDLITDQLKKSLLGNIPNVKVRAGFSSNEVLALLPRHLMAIDPQVIGHDAHGIIIEWHYPNVIFTIAYAPSEYEGAYCVQQIQVRE